MAQTYVRTPASCNARGHAAAADAEVGNLRHCLVLISSWTKNSVTRGVSKCGSDYCIDVRDKDTIIHQSISIDNNYSENLDGSD